MQEAEPVIQTAIAQSLSLISLSGPAQISAIAHPGGVCEWLIGCRPPVLVSFALKPLLELGGQEGDGM